MIALISSSTAFLRAAAAAFALLAISADVARAQALTTHSFGYKFAGSTEVDIIQCTIIPFATTFVNESSTYLGTPPFTVWAFEAGGVSDRQDGGNNQSNIPWRVRHAPGAQLFITITDGNGDMAGFPPRFFTVKKGLSDACMPKLPDNLPRISANISNVNLETCQPWGMNITGGTAPYAVTIIATDSPVFTNVSAPDDATDRFTYINRADPDRTMIVAVSDLNGNFGYSSQPVKTHGSANTSCVGLNSSWRRAVDVEAEIVAERKAIAERKENQKIMIIVGVVVGVVGFIILCVLCFWLWRRIVMARSGVKTGSAGFDMEPITAYFPPPTGDPRQMQMMEAQPYIMSSAGSQYGQPITPHTGGSQAPILRRQPSSGSAMYSVGSSYSQRDELPPLPTEPFDPYTMVNATPANRKAAEAAAERRAALAQEESTSISYSNSQYTYPALGIPSRSMSTDDSTSGLLRHGPSSVGGSGGSAPSVVGTDDGGAIILQHRDGGAHIVELPPSYDPGSYRRQSAQQQQHGRRQSNARPIEKS